MAMEQPKRRGAKRDGERGGYGKNREEGREGRDKTGGRYTPRLLGKAYFQRKKGCPFSGPKAPKIDYKDVRLLQKYVSDYGKILPRHLTGVCAAKQRELATAIKRARMLALMPFSGKLDWGRPPAPRGGRDGAPRFDKGGDREGGYRGKPRDAAPAAAAE